MDVANDRTEIANLLARYCLTLDHHDIDGWVSLFTPEAQYVVYGRTFEGREGLRDMMGAAPRGLHLGGPPEIDLHGDRAVTRQNLLFCPSRHAGAPPCGVCRRSRENPSRRMADREADVPVHGI